MKIHHYHFWRREMSHAREFTRFYEVTERLDDLTLFYLFTNCELANFQEIVQDKKWIKAIVKNDTWDFVTFSRGHKAISVK